MKFFLHFVLILSGYSCSALCQLGHKKISTKIQVGGKCTDLGTGWTAITSAIDCGNAARNHWCNGQPSNNPPTGNYGSDKGCISYNSGSATYFDLTAGECWMCLCKTQHAECSLCPSGKYQDQPDQPCCKSCAIGTYQGSTGQAQCSGCAAGKYQNELGKTSCKSCPIGKIIAASSDSPYKIIKSKKCTDYPGWTAITNAIDCRNHARLKWKNGQPLYNVNSGDYSSAYGCISYNDGSATYFDDSGYGECWNCLCIRVPMNDALADCKSCPAGWHTWGSGYDACTACATGKYNAEKGKTTPDCNTCPYGQYQDQTGEETCKSCAVGKYGSSGLSQTSSSHCVDCEAGRYQGSSGQTTCKSCADGHYSTGTAAQCTSCPIGKFAPAGTFWTKIFDGECGGAEIRMYESDADNPGNTLETRNEACATACLTKKAALSGSWSGFTALGFIIYQPEGGHSASGRCYCESPASTCSRVAAGGGYVRYDWSGAHKCTVCPQGYFQDTTGNTACQACPVGQFQDEGSQSGCKACETGRYNPVEGRHDCTSCAAGKYMPSTGSTDISQCKVCAIGTYSLSTGASACTACPAGQKQVSTGQTSCTTCVAGKYQSSTGQTSCIDCDFGKKNFLSGQTSESACKTISTSTYIMKDYGSCGFDKIPTSPLECGMALNSLVKYAGQFISHVESPLSFSGSTIRAGCYTMWVKSYIENSAGSSSCYPDCESSLVWARQSDNKLTDYEFGSSWPSWPTGDDVGKSFDICRRYAYKIRTSGKCTDDPGWDFIQTTEQCSDTRALKILDLVRGTSGDATSGHAQATVDTSLYDEPGVEVPDNYPDIIDDRSTGPFGCKITGGTTLQFNEFGTGDCTSSYTCICVQKENAEYKLVDHQTCWDQFGYEPVTTVEECKEASDFIGLVDTAGNPREVGWQGTGAVSNIHPFCSAAVHLTDKDNWAPPPDDNWGLIISEMNSCLSYSVDKGTCATLTDNSNAACVWSDEYQRCMKTGVPRGTQDVDCGFQGGRQCICKKSDAKYKVRTKGKCTDEEGWEYITEMKDCEEASILFAGGGIGGQSDWSHAWPMGCVRHPNGQAVYLNIPTEDDPVEKSIYCGGGLHSLTDPNSRSTSWQKFDCLCKRKESLRTKTAGSPVYKVKTSGSCDADFKQISTAEDCQSAIDSLGLQATKNAATPGTPNKVDAVAGIGAYPPGCFNYDYGVWDFFKFNPRLTNGQDCNNDYGGYCICEKRFPGNPYVNSMSDGVDHIETAAPACTSLDRKDCKRWGREHLGKEMRSSDASSVNIPGACTAQAGGALLIFNFGEDSTKHCAADNGWGCVCYKTNKVVDCAEERCFPVSASDSWRPIDYDKQFNKHRDATGDMTYGSFVDEIPWICPDGFLRNENTECVACPEGKFMPLQYVVESHCIFPGEHIFLAPLHPHIDPNDKLTGAQLILSHTQTCSGDYYLDMIDDKMACVPCPEGTYIGAIAHNYYSQEACKSVERAAAVKTSAYCSRGTFLSDRYCKVCPPGTFMDRWKHEHAECFACPTGRFSDEYGLSKCKECPSGHTNTEDKRTCDSCAVGYGWDKDGFFRHPEKMQYKRRSFGKCTDAPGWRYITDPDECLSATRELNLNPIEAESDTVITIRLDGITTVCEIELYDANGNNIDPTEPVSYKRLPGYSGTHSAFGQNSWNPWNGEKDNDSNDCFHTNSAVGLVRSEQFWESEIPTWPTSIKVFFRPGFEYQMTSTSGLPGGCPASHPYLEQYTNSEQFWCYETNPRGSSVCNMFNSGYPPPNNGAWGTNQPNCVVPLYKPPSISLSINGRKLWYDDFKEIGQGTFHIRTYGTCTDLTGFRNILSKDECESAAAALGTSLSAYVFSANQKKTVPRACYKKDDGIFFYNDDLGGGMESCTAGSSVGCVCARELRPTIKNTADPDVCGVQTFEPSPDSDTTWIGSSRRLVLHGSTLYCCAKGTGACTTSTGWFARPGSTWSGFEYTCPQGYVINLDTVRCEQQAVDYFPFYPEPVKHLPARQSFEWDCTEPDNTYSTSGVEQQGDHIKNSLSQKETRAECAADPDCTSYTYNLIVEATFAGNSITCTKGSRVPRDCFWNKDWSENSLPGFGTQISTVDCSEDNECICKRTVQPAEYTLVVTGSCREAGLFKIQSAEECRVAARSLDLSTMPGTKGNSRADTIGKGCIWYYTYDESSLPIFNELGPDECTSNYQCICSSKPDNHVKYKSLDDGICIDEPAYAPVISIDDCKQAMVTLNVDPTQVSHITLPLSDTYPQGCWVSTGLSGNIPTATEHPNVYINLKKPEDMDTYEYKISKSGCHGSWEHIDSLERCSDALQTFGGNPEDVPSLSQGTTEPSGCYQHSNGILYFNRDISLNRDCTKGNSIGCVCQRKTQGKCGENECICKGTPEHDYIIQKSGKCSDTGHEIITNPGECHEAAQLLGLKPNTCKHPTNATVDYNNAIRSEGSCDPLMSREQCAQYYYSRKSLSDFDGTFIDVGVGNYYLGLGEIPPGCSQSGTAVLWNEHGGKSTCRAVDWLLESGFTAYKDYSVQFADSTRGADINLKPTTLAKAREYWGSQTFALEWNEAQKWAIIRNNPVGTGKDDFFFEGIANLPRVMYEFKSSGKCTDDPGWEYASTADECTNGAIQLGYTFHVGQKMTNWEMNSDKLVYHGLADNPGTTYDEVTDECAKACSHTLGFLVRLDDTANLGTCYCQTAFPSSSFSTGDVYGSGLFVTTKPYRLKTSGFCEDSGLTSLMTTAECDVAAAALGWDDTSSAVNGGAIYIKGCYQQYHSGAWHTYVGTTGTNPCNLGQQCACHRHQIVTPINTVPTYKIRTSGRCSDESGWRDPVTKEECEFGRASMGLGSGAAGASDQAGWPQCFLNVNDWLGWSIYTGTPASCSSGLRCICAFGEPEPPVIKQIISGTCEEHGYEPIRDRDICYAVEDGGFGEERWDENLYVTDPGIPWGCAYSTHYFNNRHSPYTGGLVFNKYSVSHRSSNTWGPFECNGYVSRCYCIEQVFVEPVLVAPRGCILNGDTFKFNSYLNSKDCSAENQCVCKRSTQMPIRPDSSTTKAYLTESEHWTTYTRETNNDYAITKCLCAPHCSARDEADDYRTTVTNYAKGCVIMPNSNDGNEVKVNTYESSSDCTLKNCICKPRKVEDICLTPIGGINGYSSGCDGARHGKLEDGSKGAFSYTYCTGGHSNAASHNEWYSTCCVWSNSECVPFNPNYLDPMKQMYKQLPIGGVCGEGWEPISTEKHASDTSLIFKDKFTKFESVQVEQYTYERGVDYANLQTTLEAALAAAEAHQNNFAVMWYPSENKAIFRNKPYKYSMKESGTCETPAEELGECMTGAIQLGFRNASTTQNDYVYETWYDSAHQKGCLYNEEQDKLILNDPANDAANECGFAGGYNCLCRESGYSDRVMQDGWLSDGFKFKVIESGSCSDDLEWQGLTEYQCSTHGLPWFQTNIEADKEYLFVDRVETIAFKGGQAERYTLGHIDVDGVRKWTQVVKAEIVSFDSDWNILATIKRDSWFAYSGSVSTALVNERKQAQWIYDQLTGSEIKSGNWVAFTHYGNMGVLSELEDGSSALSDLLRDFYGSTVLYNYAYGAWGRTNSHGQSISANYGRSSMMFLLRKNIKDSLVIEAAGPNYANLGTKTIDVSHKRPMQMNLYTTDSSGVLPNGCSIDNTGSPTYNTNENSTKDCSDGKCICMKFNFAVLVPKSGQDTYVKNEFCVKKETGACRACGSEFNSIISKQTSDIGGLCATGPCPLGKGNVYEVKPDVTWEKMGSTVTATGSAADEGYSVAISANGKIMVTADVHDDKTGTDSGLIRVYEWAPKYVQISEGTCPSNGYLDLRTIAECQSATEYFGLTRTVTRNTGSTSKQCFQQNSAIFWNLGESPENCELRRKNIDVRCFCRSAGPAHDWTPLGSKFIGQKISSKLGYSLKLSHDGHRIFYSDAKGKEARYVAMISTGTCADNGYEQITDRNDCNDAINQDQTQKDPFSWPSTSHGMTFGGCIYYTDHDTYKNGVYDTGSETACGTDFSAKSHWCYCKLPEAAAAIIIYDFNDQTLDWEFNAALKTPSRDIGVSEDGNRFVVGDSEADDTGTNDGRARVYQYQQVAAPYKVMESGKCTDDPEWKWITDRYECGLAARELQVGDQRLPGHESHITDYPPGCWHRVRQSDDRVMMNESPGSEGSCKSTRRCLCKRADYVLKRPEYKLRTEGHCTDELGWRYILNQFECTWIAQNGYGEIVDNDGAEYYIRTSSAAPGCYITGPHIYWNRFSWSEAECTDSKACICARDPIYSDWVQMGKTLTPPSAPETRLAIQFGSSVDMSADGDLIVVGSSRTGGTWAYGRFHLYKWNGENYEIGGTMLPEKTTAKFKDADRFAMHVTLSADGSKVMVTQPYYDENSVDNDESDLGMLRVYSIPDWRDDRTWYYVGSPIRGNRYDAFLGYWRSGTMSRDGKTMAAGTLSGTDYQDDAIEIVDSDVCKSVSRERCTQYAVSIDKTFIENDDFFTGVSGCSQSETEVVWNLAIGKQCGTFGYACVCEKHSFEPGPGNSVSMWHLDEEAQYSERDHGTCEQVVYDIAECQQLAQGGSNMHFDIPYAGSVYTEWLPYGCIMTQDRTKIYFNSNVSPAYGTLVNRGEDPNTAAIEYKLISSGKCKDDLYPGWGYIRTVEQCREGVINYFSVLPNILSPPPETIPSFQSTVWPNGCISYNSGSATYFVVDGGDNAAATVYNPYTMVCQKVPVLLEVCEGDCDSDADCAGPLKCFQRESSAVPIPGCRSGGSGDVPEHDYCYMPMVGNNCWLNHCICKTQGTWRKFGEDILDQRYVQYIDLSYTGDTMVIGSIKGEAPNDADGGSTEVYRRPMDPVCEVCGEGQYSDSDSEGQCQILPFGASATIRDGLRVSYNQCPKGTYTGDCLPCTPGTISDVGGSAQCDQCQIGYFQDESGKSVCKSCLAGRYGDETGLDASDDCTVCLSGQYQPFTGQTECNSCPIGYFSSGSVPITECESCLPGKFVASAGSVVCDDCVRGLYTDSYGNSGCTDCPSGFYQNENGKVECVGYMCPLGTGSVAEPPAFQTILNQDPPQGCVVCEWGKFSPTDSGAMCQDCPWGFVSSDNRHNCERCSREKYYSEDDLQCKLCNNNYGSSIEKPAICDNPLANITFYPLDNQNIHIEIDAWGVEQVIVKFGNKSSGTDGHDRYYCGCQPCNQKFNRTIVDMSLKRLADVTAVAYVSCADDQEPVFLPVTATPAYKIHVSEGLTPLTELNCKAAEDILMIDTVYQDNQCKLAEDKRFIRSVSPVTCTNVNGVEPNEKGCRCGNTACGPGQYCFATYNTCQDDIIEFVPTFGAGSNGCQSSNELPIEDLETCSSGAMALGLPDVTAKVVEETNSPQNCFYDHDISLDDELKFNPSGSLQTVTGKDVLICRYKRCKCTGGIPATGCSDSDEEKCIKCDFGRFLSNELCPPITACDPGAQPSGEYTSDDDVSCESCSTGYYSEGIVCRVHSTACSPGQEITSPGTLIADITCETCPDGNYSMTGIGACIPWSQCSQSQFQNNQPSQFLDRTCKELRQCFDGEFEAQAPTETSDRVCRSLRQCFNDEFEAQSASSAADRTCQELTVCSDYEFELEAPNATKDRVCKQWTECTSTQYEFNAPSEFSDRECLPNICYCQNGTASAHCLQHEAVSCQACGPNFGYNELLNQCEMCQQPEEYNNENNLSPCKQTGSCEAGYFYKGPALYDDVYYSVSIENVDGQNKYAFDGEIAPELELKRGVKYIFTGVPGSHPLRFSEIADGIHSSGSIYNGYSQDSDAIIMTISVSTPSTLYYFCQFHSGMGGSIDVIEQYDEERCAECPNGKYQSLESHYQVECIAHSSECGPNEYQVQVPTVAQDRQCSTLTICNQTQYESAQASNVSDRVCDSLIECSETEYESVAPSNVSDRVCANISAECSETEYELSQPTETSDRTCLQYSTCLSSEYESGSPTETSDRICTPLTECSESQFQMGSINNTSDRTCVNLTECQFDEYESVAPTQTADRICTNLTGCSALQYESVAASNVSDRICTNLTECSSVQYESEAPTFEQDRVCSPLTQCSSDEYELETPDATTDRICSQINTCSNTEYESAPASVQSNRICTNLTQCTASQFEASEPTETSDRVCDGLTVCSEDQYESGAPLDGIYKSDRVCVDKTDCDDSEYEVGKFENGTTQCATKICTCTNGLPAEGANCDQHNAHICEQCDENYFINPRNRTCQTLTTCSEDEYELSSEGVDTDRQCKALTICDENEYESLAPTDSSDRVCAIVRVCEQNEYEAQAPGEAQNRVCNPISICTATQWEISGPSDTTDRQCKEHTVCNQTQYEIEDAGPNKDRTCANLTLCSEDQYESAAAAATTDRECLPLTVCGQNQYEPGGTKDYYLQDRQCLDFTECAPGYYKVDEDDDGDICAKNKCVCDNGQEEKENCPNDGQHSCESCIEEYYLEEGSCKLATVCKNTEHEEQAKGPTTDRICETNVCICEGGEPGTPCLQHQKEFCGQCIVGRFKNSESVCVPWSTCPLGYHPEGGSQENDIQCVLNTCLCPSGTPATGIECPEHNKPKCGNCPLGTYLDSQVAECKSFKCTCSNGKAASGEDCASNSEICVSCKYPYTLTNLKCIDCRCENGIEQDQCSIDSPKCQECNFGYYLQDDQCIQNMCTCDYGVASALCATEGNSCASCFTHYQIQNNICEPSNVRGDVQYSFFITGTIKNQTEIENMIKNVSGLETRFIEGKPTSKGYRYEMVSHDNKNSTIGALKIITQTFAEIPTLKLSRMHTTKNVITEDTKVSTGLIVGIVAGIIVIAIVVGVSIYFCNKKKYKGFQQIPNREV